MEFIDKHYWTGYLILIVGIIVYEVIKNKKRK